MGSRIGRLWAVLNPLMMFCIYIFVFGFVFQSKIPGSEKSLSYVIWLISGYAPWLAISEAMISAASSVISGSTLVKNIAFKTELLPISLTLLGILPMGVGFAILLPLLLIEGTGLSVNILWLILIVPLQMFFLAGIGFFLGALAVFIRDITQMLASILMLLLFFTPVFYPVEAMPWIIQRVNFLNPFYHIVNAFRKVLIWKASPDILSIFYIFMLGLALWIFGLKFFRKVKGYFQSCL